MPQTAAKHTAKKTSAFRYTPTPLDLEVGAALLRAVIHCEGKLKTDKGARQFWTEMKAGFTNHLETLVSAPLSTSDSEKLRFIGAVNKLVS